MKRVRKKLMDKIIYDLKLHGKIQSDGLNILRVSGGWIYRFWDYVKEDYCLNGTFVPYNNEFKKIKNEKT